MFVNSHKISPKKTASSTLPTSCTKEALSFLKQRLASHKMQLALLFTALLVATSTLLCMGQSVAFLINKAFSQDGSHYLNHSLLIMLVLVSTLAIASFIRVYVSSLLSEQLGLDIKKQLVSHLLKLDSTFHDKHNPSSLISQLSHDLTLVQTLINVSAPIALRNILMASGGIIMMVYTSWQLSITVMVLAPVVVSILIVFGRTLRSKSILVQEAQANAHSLADDILTHIKLSQAYNHEALDETVYEQTLNHVYTTAKAYVRQRSFMVVLVMMSVFGATAFLLWLGGQQVLTNSLSIGALTSFIFYALLTAGASGSLSEIMADYQRGLAALWRLVDILHKKAPKRLKATDKAQKKLLTPSHRLAFKNVSFSYPSRPEHCIIQDFTLDLDLPKKVAFVGPSGAGKSTLLQLLLGFYPLGGGSITLNDQDLDSISLKDRRQTMAWVPQEAHLHNLSIATLLRFGKPDASDDDLWHVLEKAQLATFVHGLKNKLSTVVGNHGLQLSAGQRQRLNLARALLKDAPLLLLDEATSALDAENQALIQKTLDGFPHKTMLIIAHRLSTVRFSDTIIVMNHGKIVSQGSHDELLSTCQAYRRLCKAELS